MKIYISLFFLFFFTPSTLLAETKPHRIHFTAQELESLQGHYSSIVGYVYINVKGKQVSTNINGKYIQLIKMSNGYIYANYKFLRIFPISLGDMRFTLKTFDNKQQIVMHRKDKKKRRRKTQIVAQKFSPVTVPPLWKKRLGKYKASLKKGKSNIRKIRLAIKNGILVAFINKIESPYPLLALSGTQLFSPSSGHNKDQTIKLSTNDETIHLAYGKNHLILEKL